MLLLTALSGMAGRTDRAPLLDWAEGPGVSPAPEPEQVDKWPKKYGASWRRLPPGELSPLPQLEDDHIVAVFVVTFDPRSGEWKRGINMGLQWKAKERPICKIYHFLSLCLYISLISLLFYVFYIYINVYRINTIYKE